MDENGLLLQSIAARGQPGRKAILWLSAGGTFCGECINTVLDGKSQLGDMARILSAVAYRFNPHISFYDEIPAGCEHFICVECKTPLKDHDP